MTSRKRLTIVGAVVAVLMVVSVVAYAATTAFVTKGINNVRIKTQTSDFTTSATTWVNLPTANFNMSVPTGQQKIFIAQFGAESLCTGASGYCNVRILMDGVEMNPSSGKDFAFDTITTGGADWWEAHQITRVAGPVPAGLHSFKVQVSTTDAVTQFRVDDWTFMVMKAAS